ncbi:TonB-dependent receptor (plasmid) [Novosphingobium aromaticivorans DSM 12444]|uniref:TonB-dependent receptor n=1 Tax=Novosphingobium aromaticivorans (strain ATCC 700278 / DSM 12444 / CCUG 56034 / CIP 105152 / NBRC 16084 / F199) TaxID=279238 RepID=A4XEL9_NOVAD|nr:TonB-dependent receptor [Novosphingobium aromaticivorans]ABP64380.1 TonB-dependent receptor [Novosphingobium aromaticivorans DSM 12444]SCY82379.1 TonB-dependent receptor [Novosphingobium aromaticivorans]
MPSHVSRVSLLKMALLAGGAFAAPSLAFAQDATAAPEPQAVAEDAAPPTDAIVVTGFRQSLQAAINVKKNAVGAVDAIVAEDIAKFPDQNLAESLQRIPGISISRDAGEGRAITVRGLSSQFTRVRVNGMETVATSTDGASANRDRAFDFNVFASELFSSIVVHKTAEASLDEGSLGAVVDLNTGNPLGGKAGFTGVASVVGTYNDLSDYVGPRLAGLLSWRNDAGTFGISLSAAYQKTRVLELGNNSVRWAQARFDSVDGTPCFTRPNSGGTYVESDACDEAALAFHPRIPRYGEVKHDRERLGITGSVQFAPTDATKFSIDGLFSRFDAKREEQWGEVLLRSNERSIDVVDPVYDDNGNMVSATLNDAWVRTEHYLRKSRTEFYQVGGTWDQDIGDSLRFTLLGGFSKSNAEIPVETTMIFDDRDAQGYSFDYTDMKHPKLTFGTSVTDPANFQLAEIRDRPSSVVNRFKTVQLRTEWDVAEGFTIKAGGMWRRFNFDTEAFTRDTAVCGNGGVDRIFGTINCSASSVFGPTAVYGIPVTAALGQVFNLGNAGQPAGNTNSWLVPNLDATTALTKLYERPLALDAGNNRGVQETTKGGYLQFDAKGELLGLRYALNAGMRYVKTDQSSYGLVGSVQTTVKRSYEDWLPSANLALYPTENVIVRAAIADVMTRPTLGSLTPGGSADGFNYRVSTGNPYLEPYRATNYDLGVEWYFAPQAVLSAAWFKKAVHTFTRSASITGLTYAQTGAPISSLSPNSPAALNPSQLLEDRWTLATTVNGEGATLKGWEFAAQVPFKIFAEGFLGNFGVIANATFISSSAEYELQGPITVARLPNGNLGPLNNVTLTSTLANVSKRAYNGTLYYDDGRFSARVMGTYRSAYHEGASGTGNLLEGYGSMWNVDASVRYKVNDWLEVSVEGNNLLDTYRYRYTDIETQRNYENNHFGRNILVGARLKY